MKIAVVGGGSTYTPELVDGLARLHALLPVDELVLIDPAQERLAVVGAFSTRLFARHGNPGQVRWTSTLDDGLDGADVVLIQLRVGGQAARIGDETFPMEFGCIGQETTGAGGLAKALRTVPVVLDVAAKVPANALIVDFTNPVGIVTRALLDAGHHAIGLCNVAIGFQRRFAKLFGVDSASVVLDHVGLNHLTWERAAYVDGVDMMPKLLEGDEHFPPELVRVLGCLPSYYLRYYYLHDEVVAQDRSQPTRGQRVADIEAELLRLYADPGLDEKPALLGERGGAFYSEAAVGLIAALLGHAPGPHAANVHNRGFFPFLADDDVIEVTCDVTQDGAKPRPAPPLTPDMAGLVAHVTAYERLAVDAALRGGRDRVYRTLLAHPLVGQHDLAERLTDRLLALNGEYLAWAR
jgi:6-phospho-beta-glucosidase